MNKDRLKSRLEEILVPSKRVSVDDEVPNSLSDSYVANLLRTPSRKASELLSSIYESGTLSQSYDEYRELMKDPVLKSALQLYADDVSNISSIDDISIDVHISGESTTQLETHIKSVVDDYIKSKLRINSELLWNWSFNLVVFGDIYIERFHNSVTGDLIDDVLIHQHPEYLTDIRQNGSSLVFIEKIAQDTESEYITDVGSMHSTLLNMDNTTWDNNSMIYDKYKYVHGSLRGVFDPLRIKLEETIADSSGNKLSVIKTYEVYKGESLLENIKYIYRIIKLIEGALWMARVRNSQRIDIINVDLGDRIDDKSTPESVAAMYKNLINKQMSLSYDSSSLLSGSSSSNSSKFTNKASNISNLIVNPIYKGRGSITHDQIDGTLDISGIKDLDYFNNKLFAGLRVPKTFLGWEESLGSSLGSGKMEELDKRYHRSVVRVTSVIENVISGLCELYLDELGYNLDNITINIIINNKSRDASERLEQIQQKLESVEPIAMVLQDYILNSEISTSSRKIYLETYKDLIPTDLYELIYSELISSKEEPNLLDINILQDITDIIDNEGYDTDRKILLLKSMKSVMSANYFNDIVKYITDKDIKEQEDQEQENDNLSSNDKEGNDEQ